LLPCGLVYAAAAVAVTSGGLLGGAADMLAFGLGTVPMMLGIGMFGLRLQFALRSRFQSATPVCLFATGLLLILRGLSLGIPYLSPALTGQGGGCSLCHF
jgi:sulfite exporter TauE/SafE